MAISNKQRHELSAICASLLPFAQNAQPVLVAAGIDPEYINMSGPASFFWFEIIKYADDFNQLGKLLEELIVRFDWHVELKNIKAEIAGASFIAQVEHLKAIIRDKQCVLFLGPEFLKCQADDKNISFNKYFSMALANILVEQKIFYEPDEDENLSYIIDRYEKRPAYMKGDTERRAHETYTGSLLNDNLYREVFGLGFPLIINTNPDIILKSFFPKECITGYYDLSNNISLFKIPANNKKTIVYNIFGSFENVDSILFTEKEAVDFTKNAYEKTPPIPEEIKDIIRQKYGIFIGFDFKEWHLKILFNVLDLNNKPGNYSLSETSSVILERNKEYYERQYNMTFIKNNIFQLFRKLK